MQILTVENYTYDLNDLPDELEEDLRFSVLDNSNATDSDFFFMPLIFLESFNSPAIVLSIGGNEVQMPLDWCILVGDPHCGSDPEVMPLTSINERGFDALVYNPISSFRFDYAPVEIINIYQDVKWYFPKLKNGHLLTVPLTAGSAPQCAFFVKEVTRSSEIVYLSNLQ
jgi:hypothetical protein